MDALVVYESLYGNTAAIAESIAAGLRAHGVQARAVPVTEAEHTAAAEVDLLVVGGPTHMHGMSRQATRTQATKDKKNLYPDPTVRPGLREWLGMLPVHADMPVAAFDTRFSGPVTFTGSAARGIAKRLRRMDLRVVVEPESFVVNKENRLVEGELERTDAWAARIVAAAAEFAAAR